VVETGIASFYSDALAGRPTASGEPYDPSQATCAHRKLPLGTVVQVERAKTGETATCRINDRGPYHDDRIIDLSRSVAEALEIEGIAKVKLRIVEPAAASE
jgi:rare lipoprotein A